MIWSWCGDKTTPKPAKSSSPSSMANPPSNASSAATTNSGSSPPTNVTSPFPSPATRASSARSSASSAVTSASSRRATLRRGRGPPVSSLAQRPPSPYYRLVYGNRNHDAQGDRRLSPLEREDRQPHGAGRPHPRAKTHPPMALPAQLHQLLDGQSRRHPD